MSEDQKMIKLCGLWKSQSKAGKVYYSGGLSYSTTLLLFPNTYKESADDNKPDLILYISKKEKKEDTQAADLPTGEDPGKDDDDVPF